MCGILPSNTHGRIVTVTFKAYDSKAKLISLQTYNCVYVQKTIL